MKIVRRILVALVLVTSLSANVSPAAKTRVGGAVSVQCDPTGCGGG